MILSSQLFPHPKKQMDTSAVEYSYSYSGQMSPLMMVIWLAFVIFFAFCGWKIFEKAGKPGWAAIVPFYNFFVLLEIVGKPRWYFLLLFIPFVKFVIIIMIYHNLSLRFGKSTGFTLGLIFLSFIFVPIFALGP